MSSDPDTRFVGAFRDHGEEVVDDPFFGSVDRSSKTAVITCAAADDHVYSVEDL